MPVGELADHTWGLKFDQFLEDSTGYVDWLDQNCGDPAIVRTSLAEARNAACLFGGLLSPQDRVLEIGAGLGIFSAFVSNFVREMVALEPGGTGFSGRDDLDQTHAATSKVMWSTESANSYRDGSFDLIISMNVLEHIDNLDEAYANLATLLARDAKMAHSCPNYSVPYEPHFGVPLLPIVPHATARLLPARIADSELWHSLNFVRARDLVELGERHNISTTFVDGILSQTLNRLVEDDEFGSRHPLLKRIAAVAGKPLDAVLTRLPSTWMTPIVVIMEPSHDDQNR